MWFYVQSKLPIYLIFYCNTNLYLIDLSSDAGMDVSVLMFKLLTLRDLSKNISGESFHVRNTDGFSVALPSELTLEESHINGVRSHFAFLAGTQSVGVSKYRIQDSLKQFRETKTDAIDTNKEVIPHELKLTEREQFVLKYFVAIDTNVLNTRVAQCDQCWQYLYTGSDDIGEKRRDCSNKMEAMHSDNNNNESVQECKNMKLKVMKKFRDCSCKRFVLLVVMLCQ